LAHSVLGYLPANIETADVGKSKVELDKVWLTCPGLVKRQLPGIPAKHFVALRLGGNFKTACYRLVIPNNQNRSCRYSYSR